MHQQYLHRHQFPRIMPRTWTLYIPNLLTALLVMASRCPTHQMKLSVALELAVKPLTPHTDPHQV